MQLKRLLPKPLKTFVKSLVPVSLIDQAEIWTGERDPLTPPTRLGYVGAGDFKEHGRLFSIRLREAAALQPTDRVLDIGSGVGRIAVGILGYITPPQGGYDGLEIVKAGVEWCVQTITRRAPHFRFHHLDIYNKLYNPAGKMLSAEVVFPFEDQTFDVIVLTSVFTHMLEADVERYFAEIKRVLKPTGRVYMTMFILDDQNRDLLCQGRSTIDFKPFTEATMVQDFEVPEKAIAFKESWVQDALKEAGLVLNHPIRFGKWSGRSDFYDYQDTLVVVKSR